MRLRVLVLGLTFFAVAIAVAAAPHVAVGHAPDVNKKCTIVGTAGNDTLLGTPGPDVICGGKGNDMVVGIGGNDILRGGPGNDTLHGDGGKDVLLGGPGRDRLHAYDGMHDHVNGGKGYDTYRDDRTLDKTRNVEARF